MRAYTKDRGRVLSGWGWGGSIGADRVGGGLGYQEIDRHTVARVVADRAGGCSRRGWLLVGRVDDDARGLVRLPSPPHPQAAGVAEGARAAGCDA